VEVLRFVDRFTALPLPATCAPPAADESICLLADKVRNKVLNNSQITGHVENGIHLHADITPTGRSGSDVPFEAVLQEYLQFPYEYFLLLLPFGCYCCKVCPSNNPRKKTASIKIT
jgi:hypothetical protein